MRNKIYTTILIFCCMALIACHTMPTSANKAAYDKKNKNALINTQLGITYLQRHQVQLAKQKLLLALQQAPNIPETWYAMAFYLEVTGDNTQANQYYLKALSLSPDNGEAHNNYGTFLCRSGNYNGAIAQFMAAVQDNNYIDTSSAYENAGLCAMKIPDRKLAMSYFNKALVQDPNMPTSLIETAQYEYDTKNYPAAKEHLRQFLTIAPPTTQSRLLSAQLGEKLGYLGHSTDKKSFLPNSALPGDIQWS